MGTRVVQRCRTISQANWFEYLILGVIVLNAITLGLETYDSVDEAAGGALEVLNTIFLGIFTVEIAIRIIGHGKRPGEFFKNGWNVFDFVVIGAAYLPGVRENTTLLRMVRVLRVFRIVSVLPEMRVLIVGLLRSLAPLGSMGVLILLLLYLYGMVGWTLYHDHDPARFDTIGQSMLTLFTVLTLEGWNDVLDSLMEVSNWSAVYLVSFVLLSSLLLLNMVIGVVINSIEEAREIIRSEERREALASYDSDESGEVTVEEHLRALRSTVDSLEERLADQPVSAGAEAAARAILRREREGREEEGV
jgi:voltage-gated sodium channel